MLVWQQLWDEMQRQFCGETGDNEYTHEPHGPNNWTETTEDMYHQQLNVLPPKDWDGISFLVGECWSCTDDGERIYAGFTKVGDTYYARYMTRKMFREKTLPSPKVVAA